MSRMSAPVPIQEWFNEWLGSVSDTLFYKEAAKNQIMFWRDDFGRAVATGLTSRKAYQEMIQVISYHTSKSVRLPVVQYSRPDLGLTVTVRDNFHNVKMSVTTREPLKCVEELSCLFHTTPPIEPTYTGDELCPVYFEGFPDEFIYSYLSENPLQWSAELDDHADTMIAIFLIMKSLGAVKPRTWHTKESHKAMLDAQAAAREE